MKLERKFSVAGKITTLCLDFAKGAWALSVDGVRKAEATTAEEPFKAFATAMQKLVKQGATTAAHKNAPALADQLIAADLNEGSRYSLDLVGVVAGFLTEEQAAIIAAAVAKAEQAGTVVGPDHAYDRARLFGQCPTRPLLKHYLERLLDRKLEYLYPNGSQNGDLQFFATVISNVARDSANEAWLAEEIAAAQAKATEPILAGWLKARLSKFRSQVKVKAALSAPVPKSAVNEEGLLLAIASAPDDDAPRLVWADWLEEQGSPWGEVVRLQCEREKLEWGTPRRDEITARLDSIERKCLARFIKPLRPWLSDYTVERGLLSQLTVSAEKLLLPGAASALDLRAPGGTLELKGLTKKHLSALAKLPEGHLRGLKVTSAPALALLTALLKSPLLRALTSLELHDVADDALEALAACLSPLRELTLINANPDRALGVIARSGFAGSLEALAIAQWKKERAAHASALKLLPRLKKLKRLLVDLAEGGAGPTLAKLRLTELSLKTSGFWNDDDCSALANAGGAFDELKLTGTRATVKGVSELLTLKLGSVTVDYTGQGLSLKKAGEVKAATLSSPDFDDADALAIAQSPLKKTLTFLSIDSQKLTDQGARALLKLNFGASLYLKGALSEKLQQELEVYHRH